MFISNKKLLTFSFLMLVLSACGTDVYISAFDRVVENQSIDSFSEGDETLTSNNEFQENTLNQNNEVKLFDRVLETSDISEKALTKAFMFYDESQDIISNKDWITIFDIKQHSGNLRFYMINMKTGVVTSMHSSHGKKSDTDHDGYADQFSNVEGSNQSSLGFMLTAETYYGKHGLSLRLDGLENRNSQVRPRAIVIHGASYVDPSWDKMGRSLGCPAVANENRDFVINHIKSGSLFYTYNEDYE